MSTQLYHSPLEFLALNCSHPKLVGVAAGKRCRCFS